MWTLEPGSIVPGAFEGLDWVQESIPIGTLGPGTNVPLSLGIVSWVLDVETWFQRLVPASQRVETFILIEVLERREKCASMQCRCANCAERCESMFVSMRLKCNKAASGDWKGLIASKKASKLLNRVYTTLLYSGYDAFRNAGEACDLSNGQAD